MGPLIACNCNYRLIYNIKVDDFDFMKEEVAKIKYTMLNGNEETVTEIK